MMKHLLLAVALCCPLAASAASFDCKKAASADEKAICANLSLNDKDVKMVTQYDFLKGLFAMGARGELQDQQREWLKTRRQCGGSVSCLNRAYDARLSQLNKVYNGINRPI